MVHLCWSIKRKASHSRLPRMLLPSMSQASLPFCVRVCYGPIQPPVQQFHTNWLLVCRSLFHVTMPTTCRDADVPKFHLETDTNVKRAPRGTGSSSLLIILVDNLYKTETTKGKSAQRSSPERTDPHGRKTFSPLTLWKADYVRWFLPPVCKKT